MLILKLLFVVNMYSHILTRWVGIGANRRTLPVTKFFFFELIFWVKKMKLCSSRIQSNLLLRRGGGVAAVPSELQILSQLFPLSFCWSIAMDFPHGKVQQKELHVLANVTLVWFNNHQLSHNADITFSIQIYMGKRNDVFALLEQKHWKWKSLNATSN